MSPARRPVGRLSEMVFKKGRQVTMTLRLTWREVIIVTLKSSKVKSVVLAVRLRNIKRTMMIGMILCVY